MGDAYAKKGSLPEAEAAYRSHRIDPTSPDGYTSLATFYNQQKRFDEASAASRRRWNSRRQGRHRSAGGVQPGDHSRNQSKIPEAQEAVRESRQLNRRTPTLKYWLGMASLNLAEPEAIKR
jgi:hypothetical protein